MARNYIAVLFFWKEGWYLGCMRGPLTYRMGSCVPLQIFCLILQLKMWILACSKCPYFVQIRFVLGVHVSQYYVAKAIILSSELRYLFLVPSVRQSDSLPSVAGLSRLLLHASGTPCQRRRRQLSRWRYSVSISSDNRIQTYSSFWSVLHRLSNYCFITITVRPWSRIVMLY